MNRSFGFPRRDFPAPVYPPGGIPSRVTRPAAARPTNGRFQPANSYYHSHLRHGYTVLGLGGLLLIGRSQDRPARRHRWSWPYEPPSLPTPHFHSRHRHGIMAAAPWGFSVPRNPDWTTDELILALDLYLRHNPNHISKEHAAIVELSEVLNSLPIHPSESSSPTFRNPNGVYMKLCNFLRLDPSYEGAGLRAGGQLEEVVWEEYANDPSRLAEVVEAIRSNIGSITRPRDDAAFCGRTSREPRLRRGCLNRGSQVRVLPGALFPVVGLRRCTAPEGRGSRRRGRGRSP